MSTIILDTNGLCAQAQLNVDILGQLRELGYNEFLVPGCVLYELERLRVHGSPRERAAAEVGSSLLPGCKIIESEPCNTDCDDYIVRKAKELNVAVFSLDRLLRRKLAAQGTQVVYIRGRKKCRVGSKEEGVG